MAELGSVLATDGDGGFQARPYDWQFVRGGYEVAVA